MSITETKTITPSKQFTGSFIYPIGDSPNCFKINSPINILVNDKFILLNYTKTFK